MFLCGAGAEFGLVARERFCQGAGGEVRLLCRLWLFERAVDRGRKRFGGRA